MTVDTGVENQLALDLPEVRRRLAVVYRILIECSIQYRLGDHQKDKLSKEGVS